MSMRTYIHAYDIHILQCSRIYMDKKLFLVIHSKCCGFSIWTIGGSISNDNLDVEAEQLTREHTWLSYHKKTAIQHIHTREHTCF
jgi:hypothetical protein